MGKILPVRYEVMELLGGSHAQKDVVDQVTVSQTKFIEKCNYTGAHIYFKKIQMVLHAAIGAGRRELAMQLLEERMAIVPRERKEREASGVI